MMDSLFSDLCCDLRERLFVKLRDANRTMTTLSSERRKTVELDGVHSSVFHGVFPHFPRSCIVRDLCTLAGPIPPKSLLRVHPSGDFCLIAPIQQCRTSLSYHQLLSSLSSSNVVPPTWLKEGFSVLEGQLLIPLSLHGESSFYQVACPSPGEELSSELSTTSIHPFPVRLPVDRDEVPVCPFFKEKGKAYLYHVRESEVRVCVENEAARRMRSLGKSGTAEDECVGAELNVGDKFVMRGEEFLVLSKEPNPFTPHAMPHVVVDKPFSFSGRHVPVRVFGSVEVRCQLGLVPEAFIHDFEPVTVDFSPKGTQTVVDLQSLSAQCLLI